MTVDPVSGDTVNIGITKFVDDVACKTISENEVKAGALLLSEAVKRSSDEFDAALRLTGHEQNKSKQVHVPVFCGTGASEAAKKFYKAEIGLIAQKARYLGPQLNSSNTFAEEKEGRIRAAKEGWVSMGKF